MRIVKVLLLGLGMLASVSAGAIGWPKAFEGVMLQGFYWDSYQTETKWTQLTAKVDELSPYFKLIWVPNSAKSSGGQGYMPIYWFTNHNSDMGTESELKTMISTYKEKGVGFIADVVINHRNGKSNWVDFPAEVWNGETFQIGTDGICSTDEVWTQGGDYYSSMARGAADEGDDFDGSRDLDHTNANVQWNCKNYCKCLLDTWGYVGFRLDMVKGYAGYYTKMYNQYAKPTYSVGEYWDSSYDAVAAWIEATGGESAAFDFPFKFAVNSAFSSNDMTKLVWYENGTTPKPAGMIHHWYQQLAVTFIDNHDTYRDDGNKFHGNWAAANAFMICSPGTPCVFWPHWTACGDQIAKMIEARNAVGVTNTSDVTVLRTNTNCYMAEVYGTRGNLAVKIGSEWVTPDGYSSSDIYCSGEDYCIWIKDNYPTKLYIMGNLEEGSWKTNVGVSMTKKTNVYKASGVTFKAVDSNTHAYFSLVTTLASSSSDWNTVNSSARYGSTSSDKLIAAGETQTVQAFTSNPGSAYSWKILPGTYDITVDLDAMTITVANPSGSTGVKELVVEDEEVAPRYYTIDGREVAHPQSGHLYILRRGTEYKKVLYR